MLNVVKNIPISYEVPIFIDRDSRPFLPVISITPLIVLASISIVKFIKKLKYNF